MRRSEGSGAGGRMRYFELNSMRAKMIGREKEGGGIMMRLMLLHMIAISNRVPHAH